MTCAPALAADPIGAVDAVTGECRIIRGGDSLAAEQEQPVMLNDEIATGADGRISIIFLDDTVLSLDESSHASIDDYVYSEDASNLLFKFTKGTFRTITGEIVKQNPEGFNMETPLVTIGIRGSDVYAIIQPEGEETGALHLGEGHALEVKSEVQSIRITESGMRVKIAPSGIIFTPTRIPASMLNNMLNLGSPAPSGTSGASGTSGTKRTFRKTSSRKSGAKSAFDYKKKDAGTSGSFRKEGFQGVTGGKTPGGSTTGGRTGGNTGLPSTGSLTPKTTSPTGTMTPQTMTPKTMTPKTVTPKFSPTKIRKPPTTKPKVRTFP